MPTIELYDYEAAGCPTKVRWALAETGLPWHRRRIDLAEFEQKSASYLRVHPGGVDRWGDRPRGEHDHDANRRSCRLDGANWR